ncbi:S9 family peptidase [Spirilliplanes yamanashiensis]|uniref:Peptidase S9 n=1 Tax=Spirilliplanes yamanashiensis TaxID=42233 RepID=A0A8J3Y5X3_9ACTN|nr:S9 family peptidase [Spirilliplanes yamanashiensis]MDP9819277.1 dipeptidyl aminopeptidase/acylaminoacyl peptidase [Spirilliplanes yamanashiensis]GIJ01900.1 peptidase S9 [Spirilliplanes yamanashiensis]
MTGQLSRVDVTVLPAGWTTAEHAPAGAWSPALSPDGRHAAYVSDRSGAPRVWVQPVGSELTFLVDTGDAPVVSVHWSTGGGWLAVVLAPGGAPRTEVWLVRPDGSALHQVAGFGADTADNVRWLPGRSLLAVTENASRALVVDAVSGERRTLFDDELIALLDVSRDGSRALVRRGPRGAREIVVRSLADGAEHMVAPGDLGVFSADGAAVYALTVVADHFRLVEVTDTAGRVVAARHDAELEGVAASADGSSLALTWNVHGGTSWVSVLDTATGSLRDVPPPGPVVDGVTFSADGSTLALTAEGAALPRSVFVTSPTGMTAVAGGCSPAPAVEPVLHTFAAHDGLTLTGWLYPPAGPGPHPTLLWFHGGPEAQERPGNNPLYQSLAAAGIAVFTPNVRGSSGFGHAFMNADNGALRHAAIADVASCVEYLVAAGVADPARVGCSGRSYGGYLTLAALVTYPSLFAVGVDVCGMSDFATFYAHTEPWIGAAAVSKYGHPVHDAALLRELSPMTRIDRLRTPLMVVHGENDSNVPVVEAEQVVAALRERGVPHRYLLFPGEGHELLCRTNRATYQQAVVDWLQQHLA